MKVQSVRNKCVVSVVGAALLVSVGCTTASAAEAVPSEAIHAQASHVMPLMSSDIASIVSNTEVSDSTLQEYAQAISEALSVIPDSALENEAAWEQFKKDYAAGAAELNTRVSWGDAAKCAGGILVAVAGSVAGLAIIKKLTAFAKNVRQIYRFLKKANRYYKIYREVDGKRRHAAYHALRQSAIDHGGQEFVDVMLQIVFGTAGGTVTACIGAVKN